MTLLFLVGLALIVLDLLQARQPNQGRGASHGSLPSDVGPSSPDSVLNGRTSFPVGATDEEIRAAVDAVLGVAAEDRTSEPVSPSIPRKSER